MVGASRLPAVGGSGVAGDEVSYGPALQGPCDITVTNAYDSGPGSLRQAIADACDGGRITFHFTAEGRVDFRALVKDLAKTFHTRIELHQVGVRDEAKLRGGLGPCGRELCCVSFLRTFDPVSIRMAKDQDLSLNPLKISGLCGRLMCCLAYEHACYRQTRAGLPRIGAKLETGAGCGRLEEVNILRGCGRIALEEGGLKQVTLEELRELRVLPERKEEDSAEEESAELGE